MNKKVAMKKFVLVASIVTVLILALIVANKEVLTEIKRGIIYVQGMVGSEAVDNNDILILKNEVYLVKGGVKYMVKNAMVENGVLKVALLVEGKNEEIKNVELGGGLLNHKLNFKTNLHMINKEHDYVIGYGILGKLESKPKDIELKVDGIKLELSFKSMDKREYNIKIQEIKYNNIDYLIRSYIKDDKLRVDFSNNVDKERDFSMYMSKVPYDLSNIQVEELTGFNDKYNFNKNKDIYILDENNNIIVPKMDLYTVGNELMFNIKNNTSNTFKLVIPKEFNSKFLKGEEEVEIMKVKVPREKVLEVNKPFEFEAYKGIVTRVEKKSNTIKFYYKILNKEDENKELIQFKFKINKNSRDIRYWTDKEEIERSVEFKQVDDLKEGEEIEFKIVTILEYTKKPRIIEINR